MNDRFAVDPVWSFAREVAAGHSGAFVDQLARLAAERDERAVAALTAAAALAAAAVRPDADRVRIDAAVEACAKEAECPPAALAMAAALLAVRDPRVMLTPPEQAARTIFGALISLRAAVSVSLWRRGHGVRPELVAASVASPSRRHHDEARAVLAETSRDTSKGLLVRGFPVRRLDRPVGALVVGVRRATRDAGFAVAEQAALALEVVADRMVLLEGVSEQFSSADRHATRLALDLHDGPAQDIAALLSDVRHLQGQVEAVLSGLPAHALLAGRIQDLEARLVTLDAGVRDLVRSFATKASVERSLETVIQGEGDLLQARRGIKVAVHLSGSFDDLSSSQRIAIARLVHEALANVGHHSGATHVEVEVSRRPEGTQVVVADDGRGFDVEPTLTRAARQGRLGLVGMAERIRLLGGTFEIDSRPGGPTRVLAVLPPWQPSR